MKIDQEYLKGLLTAIQDSEGPFTNIEELSERGYSYESDDFVLHMEILLDKGFLESKSSSGGIGYIMSGSGRLQWSIVPLRLTASGHDFISAIQQPKIWEAIKSNFGECGLEAVKTVALDLATGYAQQKVRSLLGL